MLRLRGVPPEGDVNGYVQSPTGGEFKAVMSSQVSLKAANPTPVKVSVVGSHGIQGLGGAGARLHLRQAP